MSHEIDMSNHRANIAFTGETPWHGLGQALTAGADLATWAREAGLNWEARRTPVRYENGALATFPGRHVLYRSDTQAPLSIVSDDYHIVQPADLLALYAELARIAGFEMETAGVLSGGRRIWALAKVNDGVNVIGTDRVKPYVLLATSYDATMATVAKFTAVRVVCHNTISLANREEAGDVRVIHSEKFDPERVRRDLGVFTDTWEKFQAQAGLLATRSLTQMQADEFLRELVTPEMPEEKRADVSAVRDTKGYKAIMSLFNGQAIGSDLTTGGTAWQMLNAITQYVDHHRGRSADTRLNSAWFGTGAAFKEKAYALLTK